MSKFTGLLKKKESIYKRETDYIYIVSMRKWHAMGSDKKGAILGARIAGEIERKLQVVLLHANVRSDFSLFRVACGDHYIAGIVLLLLEMQPDFQKIILGMIIIVTVIARK